jgi:Lon-like ATP-dependent protease
VQIVKKYLVPTAIKESGLKPANIGIEDSAIQLLVKAYCREAGVRNLQKRIYSQSIVNLILNNIDHILLSCLIMEFLKDSTKSCTEASQGDPVTLNLYLVSTIIFVE